MTTADGSIFPLTTKNGLCYLEQRRPTVWEMKTLPRLVMISAEPWDLSKFDCTNNVSNDMSMMMCARSKRPMIGKTGKHQRDKDRKLLYEAGPHPYSLPTVTKLAKKLEAFSTNIDTMNTTNDNEEWDTSTYSSRETNKVRSATFFHPEKITITDGNTSHVISEISLHTTDNLTLHNIGNKTTYSPQFPDIKRKMSSVTTTVKDMIIDSS